MSLHTGKPNAVGGGGSYGDVYMWGRVTEGEEQQEHKAKQLQGVKISSIAAGHGHLVVVSSSGSVVSFARQSLRSCFSGLSLPVAAVALGVDHALLLGKDGSCYAFGSNKFGQLGRPSSHSHDDPLPVCGLSSASPITHIAAGDYHSCCIGSGIAFSWGRGTEGQLGHANALLCSSARSITGFDSDVVNIACGSKHCVAVTKQGRVWSWGEGLLGQLGHSSSPSSSRFPVEVIGTSRAIQPACGWGHSLVLCDDGKVFAWGFGGSGALGLQGTASVYLPQLVPLASPATLIFAGCSASFAICDDGRLFAWGAVMHKCGDGGCASVLIGKEADGGKITSPVAMMEGSSISAIASAGDVTAVMVNSTLTSAFPACGPSTGGTPVVLSGIGLFPTKILVKMKGQSSGKEHVIRGSFNQKDAQSNGFVAFKTPPVAEGVYSLCLSLDDGATFTDTPVTFAIYGSIKVTGLSPMAVEQGSTLPVCVQGTGLGQPAASVIKLQSPNSPPAIISLLQDDSGAFRADTSALPCGLYSVSISGNGFDYETTPYVVFVHDAVVVTRVTPPCTSIGGGVVVTLDLNQSLNVAACNPVVVSSSCDAGIPAKLSDDGRSVTFTMPAVTRASASHTLKFSANGGGCWTALKGFPLFGEWSLSSIHPSCGPLSGGTDVAVSGDGLVGSSAAKAKFVVAKTDGGDGGGDEWSGEEMGCAYDISGGCMKFVTIAAEAAVKQEIAAATLLVTLDGITWKDTSLIFNLYPQISFAEPKPKAFVVGTKGGAILIPPTDGACVVSEHVTCRFVCGDVQVEEVGSSDATGVTVQAPDFTDAGDYTVLVALNGKQFTTSGPVINVTAGKKK